MNSARVYSQHVYRYHFFSLIFLYIVPLVAQAFSGSADCQRYRCHLDTVRHLVYARIANAVRPYTICRTAEWHMPYGRQMPCLEGRFAASGRMFCLYSGAVSSRKVQKCVSPCKKIGFFLTSSLKKHTF